MISHDDFLFSYCAHLFLMVYTCFYKRIEKLGWRVKSGERECVWFYGWGANGVGLGNSQEGDFPPLLAEFDIDCPAIRKVLGPCLNKTTFTARQMLKDMQEVQDGENLQQNFYSPRCSVQSLALDFSHNRLLHFEYVTPQIVGVPAAAVALNLHYTYLPQIRDDGGGIWGIRIRGPGGTTAFQRGCRQPSVI